MAVLVVAWAGKLPVVLCLRPKPSVISSFICIGDGPPLRSGSACPPCATYAIPEQPQNRSLKLPLHTVIMLASTQKLSCERRLPSTIISGRGGSPNPSASSIVV